MSTALASVAADLETAAGATTSTNPNPPGYWSRIAAALEVLADATTSANATTSGYMLRAALALESIAGTDGNEENASYSGYLKRIVDALEVQAGTVEVGSLEHRMVLAAASAEFGPPELPVIANGTFDDGSDWTLVQGGGAASIAITEGALVFTSGSGGLSCTATQTLSNVVAGTVYTLSYDVVSSVLGLNFFSISIGGGTEVPITGTAPATGLTMDITAGGSNSNIRIRGTQTISNRGGSIDNLVITSVA